MKSEPDVEPPPTATEDATAELAPKLVEKAKEPEPMRRSAVDLAVEPEPERRSAVDLAVEPEPERRSAVDLAVEPELCGGSFKQPCLACGKDVSCLALFSTFFLLLALSSSTFFCWCLSLLLPSFGWWLSLFLLFLSVAF